MSLAARHRPTAARPFDLPPHRGASPRALAEPEGRHPDVKAVADRFEGAADLIGDILARSPHSPRWRDYLAVVNATKAISGLSEFSDPDGGNLVPSVARVDLWRQMLDLRALPFAWVPKEGTAANAWSRPAAKADQAAEGRFGFQTELVAEGAPFSKKKVQLRVVTQKLSKRALYIDISDELYEDAAGIAARLAAAVAETFAHDISVDILAGAGAGRPLGITKSAACAQVAARGGQTAGTVDAGNLLDCWDALHADGRSRAVWFGSPTLEKKWYDATTGKIDPGLAGLVRLADPAAAESGGAPFTILGRPYFGSEAMDTAGLTLTLIDPQALLYVGKLPGGDPAAPAAPASASAPMVPLGPDLAVSMHVRFDEDINALRWTMRHDVRPLWDRPRTLASGALAHAAANFTPA